MAQHTILWRRLDLPGHELARLESEAGGWRLGGSALFSQGEPVRLDYAIEIDTRWHTRSAHITGMVGNRMVDLRLEADPHRQWRCNGKELVALAGCTDVDLGFSPSTNLLPIRRCSLAIGESARVVAAWLSFPDLKLEPLDQTYRRLDKTRYSYESAGGAFTAELTVNDTGFVTRYESLWIAEAEA